MAAPPLDLRTYLLLERAFVRRLQRSWRQQSAPTYAKIVEHCRNKQWDKARLLVPDLDMAEVGTENREWIQYMLLSFAIFGAGTVSRKKPSFVGVGTFDTFLKQVTNNFLQYLEYNATAQVQAEALQSIAEDEAKTKAIKFDPQQLRDEKGRWAKGSGNLGTTFLHGTVQGLLDDIITHGLRGAMGGLIHPTDKRNRTLALPGHVYMTTDEREAKAYARIAGVSEDDAQKKGVTIPKSTIQDVVYDPLGFPLYQSGTEIGGTMPVVLTIELPASEAAKLRKDTRSDLLMSEHFSDNKPSKGKSQVARSYKGDIKPEWITSISYLTRDIATGVETWHTITPKEWKSPKPTEPPPWEKEGKPPPWKEQLDKRLEGKAAADTVTFYVPFALSLQSIAKKYDQNQPRDAKGRWVDEDNVTHVGESVELYHGTSQLRARKILKKGLKIRAVAKQTMGGDPESSRNYIWMAKRAEAAKSYSEMHGRPAVLKILLPKKVYERLKQRFSGPVSVWSPDAIPAKYISLLTEKVDKRVGIGGITPEIAYKFDASKHPRGEDGRFVEATAPRIFNRYEDVGEYSSWGEKKWGWMPTPEEVERWGYKPGQATGKLLTGEPIPRENLPPVLYHVTTNAPAVEESGVLLGLLESGGLGGGQAPGVSFTSSKEDAHVIQRELRRAVQIARGDVDIDAIERWAREDEKEAGLPEGALNKAVAYAMEGWEGNQGSLTKTHTWDMTKPEGERYVAGPAPTGAEYDRIRRSLVKDALNAYLQTREEHAARSLGQTEWPWKVPILKNPILFGQQEHLAKLNPDDIRTIEVPSANIPEGALVTTGSDKFLHEVRTYSDVPVTNALYHRRLKFDASKHPRHGKGSEKGGEFKDAAYEAPIFEDVNPKANAQRMIDTYMDKWQSLTGNDPTPEALKAAEEELRALPLVHGTTVAGAVGAAREGLMSHAEMDARGKDLAEDIEDIKGNIENIVGEDADWGNIPFWTEDDIRGLELDRHDAEALLEYVRQIQDLEKVIVGTTHKQDEALGLGEFVFMTHGKKHQDYGNVAVIIDNEVIQKGWATERDIVSIPNIDEGDQYSESGVNEYQRTIVMGDDYYKVAAAHAGSAGFLTHRSRDQLFEVKAPRVEKQDVLGFLVEDDLDAAQRLADKLGKKGKVLYVESSHARGEWLQEQLKTLQRTGMWDEEAIERFRDEHEGVYLL